MRRTNERRQKNIFVTLDRRINLRRSLKSTRRELPDRRVKEERVNEERSKLQEDQKKLKIYNQSFPNINYCLNHNLFTKSSSKLILLTM